MQVHDFWMFTVPFWIELVPRGDGPQKNSRALERAREGARATPVHAEDTNDGVSHRRFRHNNRAIAGNRARERASSQAFPSATPQLGSLPRNEGPLPLCAPSTVSPDRA